MVWGIETISFEADLPPAETTTWLVLKPAVIPEADAEAERVIVLPKLPMLETVIVLSAFEPGSIEIENGFDETLKSALRNSSKVGALTCPARGANPQTFSIVGRKL